MVPVSQTCPPPKVLRESEVFQVRVGGGNILEGGGLEKTDDDDDGVARGVECWMLFIDC